MGEIARRIPAARAVHRRVGPADVGGQARTQSSRRKVLRRDRGELKLDPVDAYLTIARESGTRARVLNHLYSGDDFGDEHALRTR